MTKLIALSEIPAAARRTESAARKSYSSRDAALQAAEYRIEVAPGCHGRPSFDPPVLGWVCSRDAAVALSSRLTHMPGGTSHHRVAYSHVA